jgi:DNA/RNA endonuclease G (NUC1)
LQFSPQIVTLPPIPNGLAVEPFFGECAMKRFRISLFLCLYFFAVLASAQANRNLRLGNPSHAAADTQEADNYLLVKKQYTLSYNSSRGAPNW